MKRRSRDVANGGHQATTQLNWTRLSAGMNMILRRSSFVSLCLMLLHSAYGQSGRPAFDAGVARRIITPDPLLPVSGGMGTPSPAKSKLGE